MFARSLSEPQGRGLGRAARGIAASTIVAQRGGDPVRARTVPALVVATLVSLAIAVPDHAVAAGSGGKIRSSLNVIGPQNGGGEPSLAISPDHTIYVSAPGDAMEFWRSADGGRTFGLPVDAITSPLAQADSYCNTIPGGLKIVPSGPHAGRIYIAWLAADPLNPLSGCNLTQLAAFHSIWSAYSDDGGRSWTDRPVYDAGLLHDGSEIFAAPTLGNRGNPYVGFVMNLRTEYDIWVEASFDGGTTWNERSDGTGAPYLVNTDQGTHFFAAIAAGNPGQVDVAYLDSRTLVGSTPYGKPNEPTGDANADWNVFVGQSTNLLSGSPTFTNVKLTPAPIHHG